MSVKNSIPETSCTVPGGRVLNLSLGSGVPPGP